MPELIGKTNNVKGDLLFDNISLIPLRRTDGLVQLQMIALPQKPRQRTGNRLRHALPEQRHARCDPSRVSLIHQPPLILHKQL